MSCRDARRNAGNGRRAERPLAGAVQGLVGGAARALRARQRRLVERELRRRRRDARHDARRRAVRRPDRLRGDGRFAARERRGSLRIGPCRSAGSQTALAVPSGAAVPKVESAAELKAALLRASALYFPDATLSTAGAHVAAMLDRLDIRAALAPRLRMFANGRTAMRALADAADGAAPRLHPGQRDRRHARHRPGRRAAGAVRPGDGLQRRGRDRRRERRAGATLHRPARRCDSLALRRAAGFDDVAA